VDEPGGQFGHRRQLSYDTVKVPYGRQRSLMPVIFKAACQILFARKTIQGQCRKLGEQRDASYSGDNKSLWEVVEAGYFHFEKSMLPHVGPQSPPYLTPRP